LAALLSYPRELWVKIWYRLYLLIVEITSWLIGFIYAIKQPVFLSEFEFIDCVVKQPFLVLQLQPDSACKHFGAEAGRECVPYEKDSSCPLCSLEDNTPELSILGDSKGRFSAMSNSVVAQNTFLCKIELFW